MHMLAKDLDMGMVEDTHPDHLWYQLFTEPASVGYAGTARYRTWVIGAHKDRTTCLFDPFQLAGQIKSGFTQNVQAGISDYLVASKAEILMEALEVARKRKRHFFHSDTDDLCYLLSESEVRTKRGLDSKYITRFRSLPCNNRNLVYFLGDSAEFTSWSAVSQKIPTYRCNAATGKFWIPSQNRWMTSKEKLCSMGWPCTLETASVMNVPVIGAADTKRAADLVGNSMHFTQCATMQLIALSCFGPADWPNSDATTSRGLVDLV